jgi:hypothetical protein
MGSGVHANHRRGRAWLRAFRWIVAALVLALVPVAPGPARAATLDGSALVAVAAQVASSAPGSKRGAEPSERLSKGREVRGATATPPTRTPPQPFRVTSFAPCPLRAPLYLRHCAFLC